MILAMILAVAEGAPHADGPLGPKVWFLPSVVWHAINFAILVAVIVYFTKAAIRKAQATRRETVAKSIDEAMALRDEMRAKFNDYDARMKNIDERMNALVGEARAEAEVEKTRMIAEATQLAARVREDAKLVADQEIARARRELQEEQIMQAATLAEQILKANVNKEDQSRLSTEFMGKLEKNGKTTGGAA